jgi:hypothetical protein
MLPARFIGTFEEISKAAKQPDIAGGIQQSLNELQSFIRDRSLASVNSPDRYPAGQHTVLDTDFALRAINAAPGERRYRTSDYERTVVVDDALIEKMGAEAAEEIVRSSRADLFDANSSQAARQTGLSVREIIDLKKSNLALPVDPAHP